MSAETQTATIEYDSGSLSESSVETMGFDSYLKGQNETLKMITKALSQNATHTFDQKRQQGSNWKLRKQLDHNVTIIEQMKAELQRLHRQNQGLSTEIIGMKRQNTKSLQSTLRDREMFKKVIRTLRTEKEHLQQTMETQKAEMEEVLERVKSVVNEKDQSLLRLDAKYRKLLRLHKEARMQHCNLLQQRKHNSTSVQLEEMKKLRMFLEKDVLMKRVEIRSLSEENRILKAENMKIATNATQESKVKLQVKTLEAQIEKAKKENVSLAAQLRESERFVANCQKRDEPVIAGLKQREKELKVQLNECRKQIKCSQDEVQKMKKCNQDQQQMISELQTETAKNHLFADKKEQKSTEKVMEMNKELNRLKGQVDAQSEAWTDKLEIIRKMKMRGQSVLKLVEQFRSESKQLVISTSLWKDKSVEVQGQCTRIKDVMERKTMKNVILERERDRQQQIIKNMQSEHWNEMRTIRADTAKLIRLLESDQKTNAKLVGRSKQQETDEVTLETLWI